jgi:predicted glycogen debranching enzyme
MSVSRRLLVRHDAKEPLGDPEATVLSREWLVTNGIGGYASGTISGIITRRFHGLLVASLPAPLGRTMMLNHLAERARPEKGTTFVLDAQRGLDGQPGASACLAEFSMEDGLPVWRYELGPDHLLEKSIVMPHRQNTVCVRYRLLRGEGRLELELVPWVNFRPHETLDLPLRGYAVTVSEDRYEISTTGDFPPLRLNVSAEKSTFLLDSEKIRGISYRIEKSRGYDWQSDQYAPGYFSVLLSQGATATLTASTEAWNVATALTPDEAFEFEATRRKRLLDGAAPSLREGLGAELVFAADQFVITATGRVANAARSHAHGDSLRTVIAGYHWFTDWGRDTMISLEGLALITGRHSEARYILRTFSHYVRDGLIPNMFPEGNNSGVYYTADATLWFFHALGRYLKHTGDRDLLALLLPTLISIIDKHVQGTLFGIGVDERDGLLRQGSADHPLTWMDAKVGDLIVTPRRGKAVEINALFYNALRLLSDWVRESSGDRAALSFEERANRVRAAFNERFWHDQGSYLYDVVDGEAGDDASFRPNQILAISLDYPVLDAARWETVVSKVKERLLTPVGLRSLAPGHPDYKAQYFGDLRARDLAYHQGTVWAWLLGPFVDAWMKVHPDRTDEARSFLSAFSDHMNEACAGSISEIFDAEAPYTPRGCIAQAWSVAEVLRLRAVLGATDHATAGSRRAGSRPFP